MRSSCLRVSSLSTFPVFSVDSFGNDQKVTFGKIELGRVDQIAGEIHGDEGRTNLLESRSRLCCALLVPKCDEGVKAAWPDALEQASQKGRWLPANCTPALV